MRGDFRVSDPRAATTRRPFLRVHSPHFSTRVFSGPDNSRAARLVRLGRVSACSIVHPRLRRQRMVSTAIPVSAAHLSSVCVLPRNSTSSAFRPRLPGCPGARRLSRGGDVDLACPGIAFRIPARNRLIAIRHCPLTALRMSLAIWISRSFMVAASPPSRKNGRQQTLDVPLAMRPSLDALPCADSIPLCPA